MSKPLNEYGEILSREDTAELCGVSHMELSKWVKAGQDPKGPNQCPMGPIIEGIHYFRMQRKFCFIKHQIALLFKMIEQNQ